ncbi:shikimate dehydrogenase family protein [Pontimonas salivibrio]|nr:shikimate dehydrogenase [Pontimonas salivibrio]
MMPTMPSTASNLRFEVWGSPIRHSRSPELHQAAYRVLGLDWTYRRQEVTEEQFPQDFSSLAPEVGGLSLTMPLKEVILGHVADHRGPVDLLHAANTAVKNADGWWLDNTDWWGAWRTLQDCGGTAHQKVWLLGAGATARAVVFALAEDRPEHLTLVVRSPERARITRVLGETLGLSLSVATFDDLPTEAADWVISTLPGGVAPEAPGLARQAHSAKLFDIAYDPWPSGLATAWQESPHPVVSGMSMLVYQALGQLRAFIQGDSQERLKRENEVLEAMWQAIGPTPGADVAQPSVEE